jgi:hypothetical protein
MVLITLAESVNATNDLAYTVKFEVKPSSCVLRYTVSGPWETGLMKVIVNGNVVKDYSGWFGLWPFTGTDVVDITQYVVKGDNRIVFEVKVQWLIFTVVGPVVGAWLESDVAPGETPSGGVKPSESFDIKAILILVIVLVVVLLLVRR